MVLFPIAASSRRSLPRPKPSTLSHASSTSSRSMSSSRYVILGVRDSIADNALQFNVTNTLPDTVLENVTVEMTSSDDTGLTPLGSMAIPLLTSSTSPQPVYVSFARDDSAEYALGSFTCTLKFVSKEVDPSSGEPEDEGYPDEYNLEDVELGASDYIVPTYTNFSADWEKLKSGSSATETFALNQESIKGKLFVLFLYTWY